MTTRLAPAWLLMRDRSMGDVCPATSAAAFDQRLIGIASGVVTATTKPAPAFAAPHQRGGPPG